MKPDNSPFAPRVIVMAFSMLVSGFSWSSSLDDTHRFRLGVYEQDIDVSGSITKNPLPAFTEYRFTDRFGIGVSYQAAEIDVTHKDSRGKEKMDIQLYGPSIYLTYGF